MAIIKFKRGPNASLGQPSSDRLCHIDAFLPPPRLGVNLPANVQYVWMRPVLSGDLLQFVVRFEMVAQAKPALSSFDVMGICLAEEIHNDRDFNNGSSFNVLTLFETILPSGPAFVVIGPNRNCPKFC